MKVTARENHWPRRRAASSRTLLFAQTSAAERIEASGADICVGERTLFGCYSASIDLQKESANLVFGGHLPLEIISKGQVVLTLAGVPNAESFRHAIVNAYKAWIPGKADTGHFVPASASKPA